MSGPGHDDALQRSVVRHLTVTGRLYVGLVAALIGLVIVMAYSLYAHGGEDAADDGQWGVHNTTLVYFLGLALGGVLVASVGRLFGKGATAPVTRVAEASALAASLVALLGAILAIGSLEGFIDTLLYGHISNGVVWEGMVIALYIVVGAGLLYFAAVPDMKRSAVKVGRLRWVYRILSFGFNDARAQREDLRGLVRRVALLSLVMVVLVHGVLGYVLGYAVDQADWDRALSGPYFLTEGLLSGLAVVLVGALVLHRAMGLGRVLSDRWVRPLSLGLIAGLALHLVAWVAASLANDDAEAIWTGDAGVATFAVLLVGFVAPMAVLALQRGWGRGPLLVASALAAGTMWVKANLLLVPGLTAHAGSVGEAVHWPTLPEWGLMVGSLALFALVVAALLKVLPPVSVWEAEDAGLVRPAPETPAAVPTAAAASDKGKGSEEEVATA